jgi:hypothetical protein
VFVLWRLRFPVIVTFLKVALEAVMVLVAINCPRLIVTVDPLKTSTKPGPVTTTVDVEDAPPPATDIVALATEMILPLLSTVMTGTTTELPYVEPVTPEFANVTAIEVVPEPVASPESVMDWFPVSAPRLAAVIIPCFVILDTSIRLFGTKPVALNCRSLLAVLNVFPCVVTLE